MENKIQSPTVFISYSWEDEEHKDWAMQLVDRLIADGVDAHIDRYELAFGDRLPHFMEQEITNADYVLIICTPSYKEKADKRKSGVGYEGHIISAELVENHNEKKFIPIIRKGGVRESFPIYLSGKLGIDFKDNNKFEENYKDLLATLYGKNFKPKMGSMPTYIETYGIDKIVNKNENEVRILGIKTNEVSVPRMDGTRGSSLYKIPFILSRKPSNTWIKFFLKAWDMPPRFTTMHRPKIAHVTGDKIILDGTTIDEVKEYHRETLLLCVEEANKQEQQFLKRQQKIEREKSLKLQEHFQGIEDISKDIKW